MLGSRRALENVIRLELRKQLPAFRSAALVAVIILIACFCLAFLRSGAFQIRSVAALALALSGFLFAIILGITASQRMRDFSEAEDAMPLSSLLRVGGAYVAGVVYLSPAVFLFYLLQIDSNPFRLDWIVPSIYKLHVICFMMACWIRLPVIAAALAVFFSLVDVLCSFTLSSLQQEISQEEVDMGPPLFLVSARLLLDVVFVILVLYTTKRLVGPIYGRKESAIALNGLSMACVLYGPVTSWLIFEFLLTPVQHQSLPWAFPFIVIFRIGNILYQ